MGKGTIQEQNIFTKLRRNIATGGLKLRHAYGKLIKAMPKQKLKKTSTIFRAHRKPVFFAIATFAIIGVFLLAPFVRADQIDDQIRQLNQDTSAKRSAQAQLGSEADSLSDKIAKLQQQINDLQGQITTYQTKINELQTQIAAQEQELEHQKKVLGESIKAMYVEGDISTLEMLASSKNLSDFVDKQQYRNSVQNNIKTTLDKITALQLQLKAQKEQNEGLLKDKQTAQDQVDSQQSETNQLLSLNEGQQASLDAQIKQNNSNVATLRAQQLAANHKLGGSVTAGDPGHGGYPGSWDNAPQDSLLDSWGMYNRECVSYTAWKVSQTFGYMPGWGWRSQGNANQWPGQAQADGIATGSTPRVHSVAISMSGAFGHAMWVEGVSGNTIHVSQYNYNLNGLYSEMTINGSGLIYIYF